MEFTNIKPDLTENHSTENHSYSMVCSAFGSIY